MRHQCENSTSSFPAVFFISFCNDVPCNGYCYGVIARQQIVLLGLENLERTEITSYIHCTNPAEYSAGKKGSNTKKIGQQNIIIQTVFDTLNSHKVICLVRLTNGRFGRAAYKEYGFNRNNTSFGDFTICLALEEERGMSQARTISDS